MNVHDLHAIDVVKMGTGTVDHLPKKISMPCHFILFTITDRQKYLKSKMFCGGKVLYFLHIGRQLLYFYAGKWSYIAKF